MKTLILIPLLALTGCCYTQFNATRPDGSKVGITNIRWIWTTDGYSANLSTNGLSLTATKSSADAATAGAIAEGVATGMVKGAKAP